MELQVRSFKRRQLVFVQGVASGLVQEVVGGIVVFGGTWRSKIKVRMLEGLRHRFYIPVSVSLRALAKGEGALVIGADKVCFTEDMMVASLRFSALRLIREALSILHLAPM